jgi:hypothetical protein
MSQTLSILRDIVRHAGTVVAAEDELSLRGTGMPGTFLTLHQIEAKLAEAARAIVEADPAYIAEPDPAVPRRIRRAVDAIHAGVMARLRRWNWEYIIGPDGLARVAERLEDHRRTRYLPLLEAALAWRSGPAEDLEPDDRADAWADEAERLGLVTTLTAEAGRRVYPERYAAWYGGPALADTVPPVDSEEHWDLV